MHYRNGRPAKNGDKVIQLDLEGGTVNSFGVLYDATPGNNFCNGRLAPAQPLQNGACLIDCLHVDDLAAILASNCLDKRPPGLFSDNEDSMPLYQKRVLKEKAELDYKIEKLKEFVQGPVFQGIEEIERQRLLRQRDFMLNYSGVLAERISAFRHE